MTEEDYAQQEIEHSRKYNRDIFFHHECQLGRCMTCRLQVNGHCTRPLTAQEKRDLRWEKEHRNGSKHELQSHEMEEIAAKEGGYWRTPQK